VKPAGENRWVVEVSDPRPDRLLGVPVFHGLIEWGPEETPTLIIASTSENLHREAFDILILAGPISDKVAKYIEASEQPGRYDHIGVREWLAGLWEFTTQPSFTVLGDDDIVRAD
jgi:hypothetical protein